MKNFKYFLKKNFVIFLFLILYLIISYLKDPWHDELFTRYLIKKNMREILSLLKNDSGPPLYYILLHIFSKVSGSKIFFLRFFSTILILLSGIFLKKIFKNLRIEGFLFYFFYLFSNALFAATEARNYSLVIFFSSLFFYELTGKKRIFPLIIYLTLLNYTHYLSIFFTLYILSLIFFEKNKKLFIVLLSTAILSTPLLFLLKEQPIEAIDWTKSIKDRYSPFFFFSYFFLYFNINLEKFSPDIKYLIMSIIGYLISFLVFRYKELRKILIPFIMGIIFIFAISFLFKYIYIPAKTQCFFFIPFFIFFSKIFSGKEIYIKYPLIILFILFFIFNSLILLKPDPFKNEIKNILNFSKNDTNICIVGIWGLLVSYYMEEMGMENKIIIFPPSQAKHLGYYYYEKPSREEIEFFKKEVLESKKRFLVIWHKNDPYSIHIKKLLKENIRVYECGRFWFFLI